MRPGAGAGEGCGVCGRGEERGELGGREEGGD